MVWSDGANCRQCEHQGAWNMMMCSVSCVSAVYASRETMWVTLCSVVAVSVSATCAICERACLTGSWESAVMFARMLETQADRSSKESLTSGAASTKEPSGE